MTQQTVYVTPKVIELTFSDMAIGDYFTLADQPNGILIHLYRKCQFHDLKEGIINAQVFKQGTESIHHECDLMIFINPSRKVYKVAKVTIQVSM